MNYQYVWMLISIVLLLFDVALGTVILLAFSASCLILSAITFLFPDISVPIQISLLGAISLVITPIFMFKIKPLIVRKRDPIGLAGSPANYGKTFTTVERDYDKSVCIKLDGDLYRCELEDGRSPRINQEVTLVGFSGAIAQVFINDQ